MAKSKSSRRWLQEHFDDAYVHQAKKEGYRSRAAYKLLEIDEKDRILRKGMTVIDLGAAPGGWAQVVRRQLGDSGRVIALDILPMEGLAGVEFIQGDFREQEVFNQLLETLGDDQVDLVISDMAPNMSGMKSVDQPKGMYLNELTWDLAKRVLKPNGDLLMKVFQGSGFDELLGELRAGFDKVLSRKPKASRARSPEVYLLARGFRL